MAKRTEKKPFERNVFSKYGAPMGRPSDDLQDFTGPVHLERISMEEGDYDAGGAYWGSGEEPMYCAWDKEGHAVYFRAKDLDAARCQLPSTWTYISATKGSSPYVDEMAKQYMETALWSSNDYSDESGGEPPLDQNYNVSDITVKTRNDMHNDCKKFYEQNQALLDADWPADAAGHEFWLTRNGHGTGFWDSKYGNKDAQQILTEACKHFSEVNLYVHRGHIYS